MKRMRTGQAAAGLILFLGIALPAWYLLSENRQDVAWVETQLKAANYCTETSDCTIVAGKCPFDCHVLVNQQEKISIEAVLQAYSSKCAQVCRDPRAFSCQDNKCVWERE